VNRTQIYLSGAQHDALVALAKVRSTSASALIRDAIDGYLMSQRTPRERLDALRALSTRITVDPGAKSDGAAIVDEMRHADADRLRSLE
jgi:Arc/MetJ-type ribon-helix-helix transcriptional regulator